jgi:hypothetical protein
MDIMKIAAAVLASIALTLSANAAVTIQALEGQWISETYATTLQQTRSVVETEKRHVEALAFSIGSTGGNSRIEITSFHEGSWRTIQSLRHLQDDHYELVAGAWETVPPLKELKRFRLKITTDPAGRPLAIRGAIWNEGVTLTYRRLDAPVIPWAARLLVAGRYTDAKGGAWTFDEAGTGISPQGSFKWLPVLDPSEACIDYITLDRPGMKADAEDRTGYRWNQGKLELYRLVIGEENECPISGEKTPFAVLTQRTAAPAGRSR